LPVVRLLSRRALAIVIGLLVCAAGVALAQGRFRGFGILGANAMAPKTFPDRKFVICRLMYPEARRFGAGWRTDYPLGERNLSIRFSELTRTPVSKGADGAPNHYLVRITDDQLFECPLLMAGDVSSIGLTADDAARLRTYLLKGGFLWTDDQWGTQQWEIWLTELSKIFDPREYPVEQDVQITDPIFRAQFIVERMPQIPNIQHWRAAHNTSEQGADSAIPHLSAVRDHHGRIMVVMTHNTDIADSFEREGEDADYFYNFGPPGYALGVNVLLYALTH
jgi:hypothetical protein